MVEMSFIGIKTFSIFIFLYYFISCIIFALTKNTRSLYWLPDAIARIHNRCLSKKSDNTIVVTYSIFYLIIVFLVNGVLVNFFLKPGIDIQEAIPPLFLMSLMWPFLLLLWVFLSLLRIFIDIGIFLTGGFL